MLGLTNVFKGLHNHYAQVVIAYVDLKTVSSEYRDVDNGEAVEDR